MTALVQPGNAEAQRLAALQSHAIMDTAPEEAFDQLARLAAQVCAVPMALVNFVDAAPVVQGGGGGGHPPDRPRRGLLTTG